MIKYYSSVNLPSDIEIPMQHASEVDTTDWQEEEFNYRLNTADDIFYAVKDNSIVGHLGLKEGDVIAVYVDPEFRGEGIAEGLYEAAVKEYGAIRSDESMAMEESAKSLWKKLQKKYPEIYFDKNNKRWVWTLDEKTESSTTADNPNPMDWPYRGVHPMDAQESLGTLTDWSGKWIHYSKHPEVKINPKQFHQDPAGIYLFPKEFKTTGNWEISFPYKFEVELDPTFKVLDLSLLTISDIKELLIKMVPDTKDQETYLSEINKVSDPVDTFWELLKSYFILKTDAPGAGAWNKAFRSLGYDAIFDDTEAIHTAEVQMLVLNPAKIKSYKQIQDMPSEFEVIKQITEAVKLTCEPFGTVTVEGPKKEKDKIKSYVRVEHGDKSAAWDIQGYKNKGDAYPQHISVLLTGSRLPWESGRSWGGSADFRNWKKDWPKISEDIIKALNLIFEEKEETKEVTTEVEVTAVSTSDLERISRWYMDNVFKDSNMPMPDFVITDSLKAGWLGQAEMNYQWTKPKVRIQKSILNDEKTLDRVLAHELIHVWQYTCQPEMVEYYKIAKENNGRLPREQAIPLKKKVNTLTGHGASFEEWAEKINAVKGKDYVTEVSDETYVEQTTEKEFYVFIEKQEKGDLTISTFIRPSPQIREEMKRRSEDKETKLVKTNDKSLLMRKNLTKFGGGRFLLKDEVRKKKIEDLWKEGKAVTADMEGGWRMWEAKPPYDDMHPMDDLNARIGSPTLREEVLQNEPPGRDRHPEVPTLDNKKHYQYNGEEGDKWTQSNITNSYSSQRTKNDTLKWQEKKITSALSDTYDIFSVSNHKIAKKEIYQYCLKNKLPQALVKTLSDKLLDSPVKEYLDQVEKIPDTPDKNGRVQFRVKFKDFEGYSEDATNLRMEFEAFGYPEYSTVLTLTFLRIGPRKEFYTSSNVITSALQFKTQPTQWNGMSKLEKGVWVDNKAFVISDDVITWVNKYCNIPEPEIAQAIADTGELPLDFYRVYKPIFVDNLEFTLYDMKDPETFQDFVLKVLLKRSPIPKTFMYHTLRPEKSKKVLVQDFLKRGKLSLSGVDNRHQYGYSNNEGGISWQQKEQGTGSNLWKKTESRPSHRWELTSMSELFKDFETYWMDLEVAKKFQHQLSLLSIETSIKQAYLLWLKSERHISDVERIGPDVATSKGSFVFYCRIKTKAQKGYDKDSIRAIFEAEYFKGQPTLFLNEFIEVGPKLEVYKKYKDKTPVTSAVTSTEELIGYHVTYKKNLNSILKKGLIPKIGERSDKMETEKAIYFFESLEAVEDALMNWLGEELDEDEEIVILEVDLTDIPYTRQAFELQVKTAISPDRIIKVLNENLVEGAASPTTKVDTFIKNITEVAEEAHFEKPDKAYYNCTDFCIAVYEIAKELGISCEILSADVKLKEDLGEINAGDVIGHSFLKIENKFYDFTASQIDSKLPFPIISSSPIWKNSSPLENRGAYDPMGWEFWHKKILNKYGNIIEGSSSDNSDLDKKAKEITGYQNCRTFVQQLTGISNIEAQPEVKKSSVGDIFWWGTKQGYRHVAVDAGDGMVWQVEEWGAAPEKKKLSDLIDYWDKPDKIFKGGINKVEGAESSEELEVISGKDILKAVKPLCNKITKAGYGKPEFRVSRIEGSLVILPDDNEKYDIEWDGNVAKYDSSELALSSQEVEEKNNMDYDYGLLSNADFNIIRRYEHFNRDAFKAADKNTKPLKGNFLVRFPSTEAINQSGKQAKLEYLVNEKWVSKKEALQSILPPEIEAEQLSLMEEWVENYDKKALSLIKPLGPAFRAQILEWLEKNANSEGKGYLVYHGDREGRYGHNSNIELKHPTSTSTSRNIARNFGAPISDYSGKPIGKGNVHGIFITEKDIFHIPSLWAKYSPILKKYAKEKEVLLKAGNYKRITAQLEVTAKAVDQWIPLTNKKRTLSGIDEINLINEEDLESTFCGITDLGPLEEGGGAFDKAYIKQMSPEDFKKVLVIHDRTYQKNEDFEKILKADPFVLLEYEGDLYAHDCQHRINYILKHGLKLKIKCVIIPLSDKEIDFLVDQGCFEPSMSAWHPAGSKEKEIEGAAVSAASSKETDEDVATLMNRIEDKYFVLKSELPSLIKTLSEELRKGDIDTEVRFNVNRTFYLDNDDLMLFSNCVFNKKPRMKIRIRQYAPNGKDWENVAYLEFKIKRDTGDIEKVRVRIFADQIENICAGNKLEVSEDLININKDISKKTLIERVDQANYFIATYGLRKQLYVQYERRAYSNKKIRVTIDQNIKYFDATKVDENIVNGIMNSPQWPDFTMPYHIFNKGDYVIVEVKHQKEVPNWLTKELNRAGAKKHRFSKYCGAMVSFIENKQSSEGSLQQMVETEKELITSSIEIEKINNIKELTIIMENLGILHYNSNKDQTWNKSYPKKKLPLTPKSWNTLSSTEILLSAEVLAAKKLTVESVKSKQILLPPEEAILAKKQFLNFPQETKKLFEQWLQQGSNAEVEPIKDTLNNFKKSDRILIRVRVDDSPYRLLFKCIYSRINPHQLNCSFYKVLIRPEPYPTQYPDDLRLK